MTKPYAGYLPMARRSLMRMIGFMGTARDVTARKRQEAKLEERIKEPCRLTCCIKCKWNT